MEISKINCIKHTSIIGLVGWNGHLCSAWIQLLMHLFGMVRMYLLIGYTSKLVTYLHPPIMSWGSCFIRADLFKWLQSGVILKSPTREVLEQNDEKAIIQNGGEAITQSDRELMRKCHQMTTFTFCSSICCLKLPTSGEMQRAHNAYYEYSYLVYSRVLAPYTRTHINTHTRHMAAHSPRPME